MANFTDELINAYDVYSNTADYTTLSDVDRSAAQKAFRDALKVSFDPATRTSARTGIIDVVNFHKAYDKDLAALNLLDSIFDNSGTLAHRGTYGKIKELDKAQYPDLVRDLGNFWAAQFKDYLPTKEEAAKRDLIRQQQEEAERKKKEKERVISQAIKTSADAVMNRLVNEPEVAAIMVKLNPAEKVYELRKNIYADDTKVYGDITIANIVDGSYYRLAKLKHAAINFDETSNTAEVNLEADYNDLKATVVDRLTKLYDQLKLPVERKLLIKKVTGHDEKYFNGHATVIVVDKAGTKYALDILPEGYSHGGAVQSVAYSVYFTDLAGKEVDLAAIKEEEFPLEIIAINFEDHYEHNINSMYGHASATDTICLTDQADESVYSYFKLVKKEDEVEVLDRKTDPLTSISTKVETNKDVKGTVYPTVVTISTTSYND